MKTVAKLLVGLALADLLAAIDSTAVSIALPKIADYYQMTPSGISWVQTLYTLALVIILIPSGKIGDVFGHKRNFIAGLVIFGLASAGIIFAPTYAFLIILRIIQGAAAAMLYTASGALIAHHWKRTEMAFGITAAFFSVGLLLGPVIGGILTDMNILHLAGWHLIFALNIPIVLVSLPLVLKSATETPTQNQRWKMDWIGLGLLIGFLGGLIVGLVTSQHPIGAFIISALSLLALVMYEYRNRDPLIRLEIFSSRTFAAISIFTLVVMFVVLGLSFINTFYLQDVLGKTATQAGILMVPIFLGMGVFAVIAGQFHNWRVGTILASIFVIAGLLVLSRVTPSTPYFKGLFWGYLLASAGGGLMMTNTFAAALGSVKKEFLGLASGYINTAQQIGTLSGIAFVAGQPIVTHYQNIYTYLLLIAIIALLSALFVRNQVEPKT